jgi:nucleotide-binding universal stress UspA family protein
VGIWRHLAAVAERAMKILLAVDGSEIGLSAVRHVVALGKALANAPTLTLLYADPPLFKAVAVELGVQGVAKYHADNADYALKKARTLLKRAQLAFTEKVVVAEPAVAILKQAKADKADLIVMGSHGRGALKSLFVGSVAMKVIATSPVPVVVAR